MNAEHPEQPRNPELLLLFYRQFQHYPERLKTASPESLFQLLHDLKGGAGAAGLTRLAQYLSPLAQPERALTQAEVLAASQELASTLADLRHHLPEGQDEEPVQQLERLLVQHNARAIKLVQAWQHNLTPPLPQPVLAQLAAALQEFNFPAAQQLLQEHLNATY